jgi:hypothetical protein
MQGLYIFRTEAGFSPAHRLCIKGRRRWHHHHHLNRHHNHQQHKRPTRPSTKTLVHQTMWPSANGIANRQGKTSKLYLWLTLILLMWRIGWAPNSIPIFIQQYAMLHSLFISGNCSTCLGWYFHPSSGAHTTVSTASGICHTVTHVSNRTIWWWNLLTFQARAWQGYPILIIIENVLYLSLRRHCDRRGSRMFRREVAGGLPLINNTILPSESHRYTTCGHVPSAESDSKAVVESAAGGA